jgi:hypothetical protein
MESVGVAENTSMRFPQPGDQMQPRKPRLTYANVVATLALFFALCGGAAFAATKIRSADIAPGAVRTADIHKRAITSGKLARGAVHGNQIAPHSVGSSQIVAGSIRPDQLEVPVSVIAKGSGDSQLLPSGSYAYPLSGAEWTQRPGEVNLIMAEVHATLAFAGSFPNGCRLIMNLKANGNAIGSLELVTETTQMLPHNGALPMAPVLPPAAIRTNEVTADIITFGCTPESRVDSVELQVLGIG